MIRGKKILAVVPARGGSKGLPLKNIRMLGGRPLIAWTGDCISRLPEIDRAVVSTDHDEIAGAAEACGLSAPFRRPENLSGDRIGDLEVLIHALQEMEKLDQTTYDIVVMLQPTSPLRREAHVRKTLEKLVINNLDAVWTVTASDLKLHPLKQLVVEEDGSMRYYDPAGAQVITRQELKSLYHRNGAAYALTRACLLEKKSLMGENASAVIIEDALVNIDDMADLEKAEASLKKELM